MTLLPYLEHCSSFGTYGALFRRAQNIRLSFRRVHDFPSYQHPCMEYANDLRGFTNVTTLTCAAEHVEFFPNFFPDRKVTTLCGRATLRRRDRCVHNFGFCVDHSCAEFGGSVDRRRGQQGNHTISFSHLNDVIACERLESVSIYATAHSLLGYLTVMICSVFTVA